MLEVDGERKTYAEWSKWAKDTLGISLPTELIRSRIREGLPPKYAVSKPVNVALSISIRAAKEMARAERGEDPTLTRRGPEGLAPFLRGGAAGAAARAALPKAPPGRKVEP